MKSETNLSRAIQAAGNDTMYDTNVKNLLADVQVLSRLLKYTMSEFRDMGLEEIMKCISDVQVESAYVDAGLTNLGKVKEGGTENVVPNEGKIIYDIRFTAYLPDVQIKILLNVEAQKSIDPKKLGYHLGNRVVYYLARMISAEKEVEFFRSEYDKIKKAVSIWICVTDDAEGFIETMKLKPASIYGKSSGLLSTDLLEGIIVGVRQKDTFSESKNELISMLEDLIKKGDPEEKKQVLCEKHALIMTQELEGGIKSMCNLSDLIIEEGIEKGIEKGRKEGLEEGRIQESVEMGVEFGEPRDVTVSRVQKKFCLSTEEAEKAYEKYAGRLV